MKETIYKLGDIWFFMAIKKEENSSPKMSVDEEIGYHKGSVNTLINERNELIKMAQIVESLMQVHLKRLEELGVRLQGK